MSARVPDPQTDPAEADLWFLPGPFDDPPEPGERAILTDWARAEAGLAARLATVAGRLGALEDRLSRGPEGWRHRLALIEAAELSWFAGDRIAPDRLALWAALRLSGVQDDAAALARIGWALRRLSGGPGPEPALTEFLGRHEAPSDDPLTGRAESWLAMMQGARALHPISRACMGFHLWSLAGLSRTGDRLEAAVTAARIAASGFAPLAMGGAGGLRASGPPAARLAKWLTGMEDAIRTAMRTLDSVEAWDSRAGTVMAPLSGRTPPALRRAFVEWPLLSAPMAESLTGSSRAAVQRNLAWMQAQGLIREVTGQGRFRMWKAV
jgi:hypothetical protein